MPLRTIGIALLGLALSGSAGAAAPPRPAAAVQEGLYEGTGRACGGTLQISQKRLTWRSPFSQCSAPAVLIDQGTAGKATRWAYRLGKPQKQCRYEIVMIERIETPGAPIAWNVSGFPSLDTYRADPGGVSLACYLVKLR